MHLIGLPIEMSVLKALVALETIRSVLLEGFLFWIRRLFLLKPTQHRETLYKGLKAEVLLVR